MQIRSAKFEIRRGSATELRSALLTKDELAAALRVSPRTVQEMVSGQEIGDC